MQRNSMPNRTNGNASTHKQGIALRTEIQPEFVPELLSRTFTGEPHCLHFNPGMGNNLN